ncbi:MAG: hypothetical protein HC916_21045 [Coleofasciculaceae cyanobacterium SM2_1_6]|nr:hypothetical protein [Coleofasciculaceae cyanobacterium SM2_1_6]
MDTVQKQLLTLQERVDALYQITEQINEKFLEALATNKTTASVEVKEAESSDYARYNNPWYQSYRDPSMEHKDVLRDNGTGETTAQSTGDQIMSTELQIQRLTAQLTAAYNRIAALEEQLISRRVAVAKS